MSFLGSTVTTPNRPFSDPPPHQTCANCGREWPPVWTNLGAERRAAGKFVPRGFPDSFWTSPKLSPCLECERHSDEQKAHDAELELRNRLREAKVPDAYHGFSLNAADMTRQRDGEDIAAFQARAKADRKFGATTDNLRALQGVREWLSSNRGAVPRKWVVVYGPPGTGKTAVLSAIARRLLQVRASDVVDLKPEQLTIRPKTQLAWDYAARPGWDGKGPVVASPMSAVVRRPAPRVEYLNAAEFVALDDLRFQRGNDALHQDPRAYYVKLPGVLMLDELAVVPPGGSGELPPREVKLFAQLLQPRYDKGSLTVIATNRSIEELVTKGKNLFGDAVADRLASAHHVRLGGPSWR